MATAKLEFDVQMSCNSCSEAVRKALENLDGVRNVEINVEGQQVLVETSLPSSVIQEAIEATDRKAVLKGLGSASEDNEFLGAAVAALTGPSNVFGVVRFLQETEENCIIDGTIDGLTPGLHGLHVCEYGDLSQGSLSLGSHYNPTNCSHGGPNDYIKHVGDLGNIMADHNGRASFRFENDALHIPLVIGRSLAVTENADDYGKGCNEQSKVDGNSGTGVACGIIARSAGLFQNPKRICVCSGRTIWDEREDAIKAATQQSKI